MESAGKSEFFEPKCLGQHSWFRCRWCNQPKERGQSSNTPRRLQAFPWKPHFREYGAENADWGLSCCSHNKSPVLRGRESPCATACSRQLQHTSGDWETAGPGQGTRGKAQKDRASPGGLGWASPSCRDCSMPTAGPLQLLCLAGVMIKKEEKLFKALF